MSKNQLPEADWFRERFAYNADTEELTWLIGKCAGRVAGCKHKRSGYIQVCITLPNKKRVNINAHRIIFLLENGYWPGVVDHEDRETSNNLRSNLRDTDWLGNARNRKVSKRNKTGVPGLHKDLGRNRYHLLLSPSRTQKTFSLRKYGSWEAAFEAARKVRLENDREHGFSEHWNDQLV